MVKVTVPARPDFVGLLRTVAGSFASGLGFSVAEIDDLRLLVSELAAHLLDDTPEAEEIALELAEHGRGVEAVVTRTPAARSWPPDGLRSSLAQIMLRSLADVSSFDGDASSSSIRFVRAATGT